MSAVICTLLDLNWDPVAPCLWKDPDGCKWKIGDKKFSSKPFLSVIDGYVRAKLWSHAAKHWAGTGLEKGIDDTVVTKHLRKLDREHRHGERGLLLAAACAATWPEARKHDAGLVDSPACPRCGHERCDEYHRLYGCPDNENIDHDDVKNTQVLCKHALRAQERGDVDCLWIRGLVPATWIPEK